MSKNNYRSYYNSPVSRENQTEAVKESQKTIESESVLYKVVKCSTLNFRKSPNGEILKEIPVGTRLSFIDETFDENDVKWTQVMVDDETKEIGYVMTNYLEKA